MAASRSAAPFPRRLARTRSRDRLSYRPEWLRKDYPVQDVARAPAPAGRNAYPNGADRARLSRQDIARTIAYVPQAHATPFPLRRAGGRADGADRADWRLRASFGTRHRSGHDRAGHPGHRRTCPARLRAPVERPTVTRADRSGARAGVPAHRNGRTDCEPRFRQSPDGALQIAELSRPGPRRGVILSTHDPDQALALSARVLALSEGRMVARSPAADVLT